jgi:hypothetical protein
MSANIPVRLISIQEEEKFLVQMREICTGDKKYKHKRKEARADEHG